MHKMKPAYNTTDDLIESGLAQIKAELRTEPDASLWPAIQDAMAAEHSNAAGLTGSVPVRSVRLLVKIAWSAAAAAAAIYIGIMAGNMFGSEPVQNDKTLYRNELADGQTLYSESNELLLEYITEE